MARFKYKAPRSQDGGLVRTARDVDKREQGIEEGFKITDGQ